MRNEAKEEKPMTNHALKRKDYARHRKQLLDYIKRNPERFSMLEAAAALGLNYETVRKHCAALEAEGVQIQRKRRMRNPREQILAYIEAHPGRISVREAASTLHCHPETVRKWIKILRLEGMRIDTGKGEDTPCGDTVNTSL